jgi:hypothetical protein
MTLTCHYRNRSHHHKAYHHKVVNNQTLSGTEPASNRLKVLQILGYPEKIGVFLFPNELLLDLQLMENS